MQQQHASARIILLRFLTCFFTLNLICIININSSANAQDIKAEMQGVWDYVSKNNDKREEKSPQCADTIVHSKVSQYRGFVPGNPQDTVWAVRWRDLIINGEPCMSSDLPSTATIFQASSSTASTPPIFFIKAQDNSPRKCGSTFVQNKPARYYFVNNLPNVTDYLVNERLISQPVKDAVNGDVYMLSQQFLNVNVMSNIVCLYKKRPPASTSNTTNDGSACFPGFSTVVTKERGKVRMHSLEVGEHVLVEKHDGAKPTYSPVYFFSHRERYNRYRYYTVYLSTGANITLSEGHFVHTRDSGMQSTGELRVGDHLVSGTIVDIRRGVASGLYAPHTRHGSLVVDDVFVSSYTTAIPPRVAHLALVPLRALYAAVKVTINMPSMCHTVFDLISLIVHGLQNLHFR